MNPLERFENALRIDLATVNAGLIRSRKSLAQLLENPVIRDGKREVRLDISVLEEIRRKCTLPSWRVYLPITFYLPAGSPECYLISDSDARLVADLGYGMDERDGKFWLAKWKARTLERKYRGCFQILFIVE